MFQNFEFCQTKNQFLPILFDFNYERYLQENPETGGFLLAIIKVFRRNSKIGNAEFLGMVEFEISEIISLKNQQTAHKMNLYAKEFQLQRSE